VLPRGPGRHPQLERRDEERPGELLAEHLQDGAGAARTDPALRDAVSELEARVGRDAHRRTVEALGVDENLAGSRELVQATLDLVRGLGLANTLSDDAVRRSRILDQWAQTLQGCLVLHDDKEGA